MKSLDLEVFRGECFGLLGPNGAGKTTTIEILEGLTEPDGGEVEILGMTWRAHGERLRARLGVQLQETDLPDRLSVEETLRLFRSFYPEGRTVEELIDVVQLGEKRRTHVRDLSGGQRQRLSVACALAGAPDVLFLDEPTTGLDPQSRRQLWDVVEAFRAGGGTMLLTTHFMDEAEKLSDRIAILDHGEILVQGTPRELIRSLGAEHVVEFASTVPLPRARPPRPPQRHRGARPRRLDLAHRGRAAPRPPRPAGRHPGARRRPARAHHPPGHARRRVPGTDREGAPG